MGLLTTMEPEAGATAEVSGFLRVEVERRRFETRMDHPPHAIYALGERTPVLDTLAVRLIAMSTTASVALIKRKAMAAVDKP